MAAMRFDQEQPEPPVPQPQQKPKKKTLLILVIILLALLVLAGGALTGLYLFTGSIPFIDLEALFAEDEDQPPRYTLAMREFQVNLADADSRRFLRTTIDLAYNERKLTKEIEERESELRTQIISILRSKRVEDFQEPGGMENLGLELMERLNEMLREGEIEAIYFKDFIFQ